MLTRFRRLPPAVRGWLPYVALAAAMMGSLAILGAAVGAKSVGGTIVPIREPGSPAPALSTMAIFSHNAEIALRSAFGLVTFGLYTTYVQVVNGFVLGAVLADAARVLGPVRTALAIAPHAVLELPAFWLAGAIGFRWLRFVWKVANSDRDRLPGPRLVLESLALTALALAMLLVAAVVETNVSVHLV
ncbi:stage II sporulation protein M [Halobacteriales archaeon Cl-PHB]